MNTNRTLVDGWAFPGTARKCHYFVDMEALCRKWGFFTGPRTPDSGKASPDDCVACRRELNKRTAADGEEAS